MKTVQFKDKLSRQYSDSPKERYLYRNRDTGDTVCVLMAWAEKLEREKIGGFLVLPDGTEVQRSISEELEAERASAPDVKRTFRRARWPMVSVNAGVNPSQTGELREFWRRNGITGVDVNRNGDVIWDSPAARKRDCEARGLYDRNGGYSDPQRRYG